MESFERFCQSMAPEGNLVCFAFLLPKVELHMHLNGSISFALLRHLASVQRPYLNAAALSSSSSSSSSSGGHTDVLIDESALQKLTDPKDRMKFCFRVFDRIYEIMDNLQFTRIAVQDVLFHYAAENTTWLEVRTSLRETLRKSVELESPVVSQEDYLRCVQDACAALLSGEFVFDWSTGEAIHTIDTAAMEHWMMEMDRIYVQTALLPAVVLRTYGDRSNGASGAVLEGLPISPRSTYERFIQRRLCRMRMAICVSVSRSLPVSAAVGTLAVVRSLLNEQEGATGGSVDSGGTTVSDCATAGVAACASSNRSQSASLAPITSIDFSGNCYRGKFAEYAAVLREARAEMRLPITLHAGEKEDDEELAEMIQFGPERFGHVVFAGDGCRKKIVGDASNHVELCPSSNLLTCGHDDMDNHHIGLHLCVDRYATVYPDTTVDGPLVSDVGDETHNCCCDSSATISINSDDRGVFCTSMTEELLLVTNHSMLRTLSERQQKRLLWALQRGALRHSFSGEGRTWRITHGQLEERFDLALGD